MKAKYLVPKTLRPPLNQLRIYLFDRVTNWAVLRRLQPYRREFGRGRGKYIDRFYIENFFAANEASICGRVAEIQNDHYTKLFGGNKVQHSDILDIDELNEKRTMTIDLTQTPSAPESVFDCILCPQTIFEIYDYTSAVRSLYKMLKPGGVLLVTVPGICSSVRGRMLGGAGDDWWRFTERSSRRIFGEIFATENVAVHTYGNVLTATAFLHGLVQEELTQTELEYHDPDFEVTIGVRATKPLVN